jgi:FkbM family methyltransferase
MTQNIEALTIRAAQGGPERAFYFRPNTSDVGVINDVFTKANYDLGKLDRTSKQHRCADISAFLAREKQRTGKRPLIVDAGANIGATSFHFLSAFPAARVVAIEPEATNFQLLRTNVAGLDVECMQAAVSATSGRAAVSDPGEGHWGFRTEKNSQGNVPCITLNDIYCSNGATHFPFIAKIDIEGGEADLFSANTEWVAQTPILIVELHDWLLPKQHVSRSFLRCIAALERDLIYVGEDVYSISDVI